MMLDTVAILLFMVYTNMLLHVGSGLRCTVCLVEFSEGEDMIEMPCTHLFHPGCILPWLEKVHYICIMENVYFTRLFWFLHQSRSFSKKIILQLCIESTSYVSVYMCIYRVSHKNVPNFAAKL